MFKMVRTSVAAIVLSLTFVWGSLNAQQPVQMSKSDAPLVVEGVVRQVFRSARPSRSDYLVELDVQRSEGRSAVPAGAHVTFPGPGESMYVHLVQQTDTGGRVLSGSRYGAIPAEGAKVRAYLTPRQQGGWEGRYPDGFDVISPGPGAENPADTVPPIAESPLDQPAASPLGITYEPVKIGGRFALRVKSVERRGAGQQAGLEEGDMIIGVNGAPLENAEQLEGLARRGAPFSLVVADVRTGRAAQVQIVPTLNNKAATEDRSPSQPAPPARASLGISAESVTVGFRTALKVTRVEPGSPAEKVGLEPGDVIVEADGAPITNAEQLVSAVRKSGPTLELTVRDSRTGRNTPVKVALGGAEPPSTVPTTPTTPQSGTGTARLGVVTELAFHNDEFAVKVSEVQAGSPAARAGLRPGMLILKANGKAVLHPDELTDAVRQAGASVRLTVVDPTSGREDTINVTLR